MPMPTPITPGRLAELKAMPHDPNSSYAVINREDFEGLIAFADTVFNPPASLRGDFASIGEWYLGLITPAGKETT